jgi:hypothetical protein
MRPQSISRVEPVYRYRILSMKVRKDFTTMPKFMLLNFLPQQNVNDH